MGARCGNSTGEWSSYDSGRAPYYVWSEDSVWSTRYTVTASSDYGPYTFTDIKIDDGIAGGYWRSEQLLVDGQWLAFDFGEQVVVRGVRTKAPDRNHSGRSFNQYALYCSEDLTTELVKRDDGTGGDQASN